MAYVIAEPCIAACDTACVEVCPVECIHGPIPARELALIPPEERPRRLAGLQLYIDPESCTCCGACAPACPVDAIFDEVDLPDEWRHYQELNAQFFATRGA
jgi:NAD-dependent dihydropyrimidine dehydrogenase PreA subunit